MRKWIKELAYAILAGFCIGLGAMFLLTVKAGSLPAIGATVLGAVFFTIGLFTICTRGYNLFTGKVCYVFDNKPNYLLFLLVVWIGNLLGCMLLAGIVRMTSINAVVQPVAATMVDGKMADLSLFGASESFGLRLLSLFFLGVICDVFIFIAVNGFAKNPHELGKYLSLIFGVTCFIVCGTEHSIADMFYWCVSGRFYTAFGKSILCILVITLGNSVGGFFFPLVEKLVNKKKEEKKEETKVQ